MNPERLANLREKIETIERHRAECPHESWAINDVVGVSELLADRDRLAAERDSAREIAEYWRDLSVGSIGARLDWEPSLDDSGEGST